LLTHALTHRAWSLLTGWYEACWLVNQFVDCSLGCWQLLALPFIILSTGRRPHVIAGQSKQHLHKNVMVLFPSWYDNILAMVKVWSFMVEASHHTEPMCTWFIYKETLGSGVLNRVLMRKCPIWIPSCWLWRERTLTILGCRMVTQDTGS
jgi:hypothetical protein